MAPLPGAAIRLQGGGPLLAAGFGFVAGLRCACVDALISAAMG